MQGLLYSGVGCANFELTKKLLGGVAYKYIGFMPSFNIVRNYSKDLVSAKLFCCSFFFVEVAP